MCCCCCSYRQSFYVLSPRPDHVGITSRGAARSRRHHLRRPQPSRPEPQPQPPEPQPPESQPPEPQAAGAAVVVATAAGAAVPPEPLERPCWRDSRRKWRLTEGSRVPTRPCCACPSRPCWLGRPSPGCRGTRRLQDARCPECLSASCARPGPAICPECMSARYPAGSG